MNHNPVRHLGAVTTAVCETCAGLDRDSSRKEAYEHYRRLNHLVRFTIENSFAYQPDPGRAS